MTSPTASPPWRLAFRPDPHRAIVANGDQIVGEWLPILELDMYAAVVVWEGRTYSARAKAKQTLLALLKEQLGCPTGIIGNVDDSLRLH